MLNGDGDENSKKKKKKKIKRSIQQHTFFVHFFDVVLHGYDVKLPSYTSYEGNVVHVCVHQKFCCLCPCSLFFTAAHFHLADHQHFGFSHRQFSCFSSNEIRLLCFFIFLFLFLFLFNFLALSLLSTSVKTFLFRRT